MLRGIRRRLLERRARRAARSHAELVSRAVGIDHQRRHGDIAIRVREIGVGVVEYDCPCGQTHRIAVGEPPPASLCPDCERGNHCWGNNSGCWCRVRCPPVAEAFQRLDDRREGRP